MKGSEALCSDMYGVFAGPWATGRTKVLSPELKENFVRFAKSLGLSDDNIIFPVAIGKWAAGEGEGDRSGLVLPHQGKGGQGTRGSVLCSSHGCPWEPLRVQEDPAPPRDLSPKCSSLTVKISGLSARVPSLVAPGHFPLLPRPCHPVPPPPHTPLSWATFPHCLGACSPLTQKVPLASGGLAWAGGSSRATQRVTGLPGAERLPSLCR